MKLLYLNPTGLFGGAERVLLDLIASIRERRPHWTILLIAGSDGPLIRRARNMGIATEVLPIPQSLAEIGDAGAGGPARAQVGRLILAASLARAGFSTIMYKNLLGRRIREIAPTLIHTNGFKMHIMAAASVGCKIPVIWHVHDYVSKRPVMRRLMRFEASHCAAAIANSNTVRNDLISTCAGQFEVATVYNAVDLDQFRESGPLLDLDELSGLPSAHLGVVRVGIVGTLARWKGHEVFLRAIAALPPESPVRAYVVGDAIYSTRGSQWSLNELRTRAKWLGLSDKVGFAGFVEDVPAAIRALDIVVHASTEPEPFGLVIAEAMACGKAIIAARAGGAEEIVNASGGAIFHRPGDYADLANCIERLVRNPAGRARFRETGRAAAERLFARARLSSEVIPVYERVVSAKYNGRI